MQAQKAEASRVEAEQEEKLEEFKAAAEQERERLRVMQAERERQEAEEAALKTKIEALQSLADAEREAKGQSDKEREDLAAKMKQVALPPLMGCVRGGALALLRFCLQRTAHVPIHTLDLEPRTRTKKGVGKKKQLEHA